MPVAVEECGHIFSFRYLEKWARSKNAARNRCPVCGGAMFSRGENVDPDLSDSSGSSEGSNMSDVESDDDLGIDDGSSYSEGSDYETDSSSDADSTKGPESSRILGASDNLALADSSNISHGQEKSGGSKGLSTREPSSNAGALSGT
ncbi:hypothetical protein BU25DRAFT_425657 [Macroventuria anomochaeta]|uniref:Uncharacterized protein n=1 Tax=Macroventuria anomochaeta TaxID=301207 RepID=A0ACB6RL45_9PLEO|nr:uncharacterized protein BU25DRAFT_425657 [Macroventuria anomochaeta]KAF2622489.1 hypothetical protein BU25DRAFT_425657 [Macroventuria anomochaeta]